MCEAPDRPGRTIGSSAAEFATPQSVWNSGTRVVPGGTALGLSALNAASSLFHLAWSTGTQPPAGAVGGTDEEGDADGVALGADEAVGVGEALADALGDVPAAGTEREPVQVHEVRRRRALHDGEDGLRAGRHTGRLRRDGLPLLPAAGLRDREAGKQLAVLRAEVQLDGAAGGVVRGNPGRQVDAGDRHVVVAQPVAVGQPADVPAAAGVAGALGLRAGVLREGLRLDPAGHVDLFGLRAGDVDATGAERGDDRGGERDASEAATLQRPIRRCDVRGGSPHYQCCPSSRR